MEDEKGGKRSLAGGRLLWILGKRGEKKPKKVDRCVLGCVLKIE